MYYDYHGYDNGYIDNNYNYRSNPGNIHSLSSSWMRYYHYYSRSVSGHLYNFTPYWMYNTMYNYNHGHHNGFINNNDYYGPNPGHINN
ncbi:hypothetical protein DCS_02035 [Drechmeria coniospora]|uniref:Uncharacterized protein n=1 Tax=Drechmeria coniospora TaxID=98403 RepID=A0A151GUV0_DRECN|nr:hypothetical protein DCS_02035 [Drechmeria coniospora]KYK60896.1 hypothetical protein DCS_02035 [Drechmeria coniospora]